MITTNRHRSARVWVWILVVILVLIVLPLIGILSYRSKGDRLLQARMEAIRAQGQPITLEELSALHILPPGTENAADFYLAAFEQVGSSSDVPLPSQSSRTEPLSLAVQDEMVQYLKYNREPLAQLHQAAKIPDCRYPTDFSQGFDAIMPWLKDVRTCTLMLKLETIAHIENNDPNRAIASMQTNMALSQSIHPFTLVEELVRIATFAVTRGTTEDLVNRTRLSDTQLQSLTELIQSEDINTELTNALQGERCMGLSIFLSPSSGQINALTPGAPARLMAPLRAVGYLQRDAMSYLDLMQQFLDALELPPHEGLQATGQIDPEDIGGLFTRLIAPALGRVVQLGARAQAGQATALTAFAIERYRLAHNEIPERLEQLVPTYLDKVPLDPFDGQPLRYRHLDPGYVVYSVNKDLTDDGGKEKTKGNKNWDVTFIVER